MKKERNNLPHFIQNPGRTSKFRSWKKKKEIKKKEKNKFKKKRKQVK